MEIIGLINNKHKGYTNSIKAFTDNIIDSENEDYINAIREKMLSFQGSKVAFITGGAFGLQVIKEIQENFKSTPYYLANFNFVYMSDRYFPFNLSNLTVNTQMFMPSIEFEKFACVKKNITITDSPLVACHTKGEMEKIAGNFALKNPQIAEIFRDNKVKNMLFLGGRSQITDTEWIENNPKEFVRVVEEFIKEQRMKGNKTFNIATHGVRSFTHSENRNDFTAMNSVEELVKSQLQEGEKCFISTQKVLEDNSRTPILKTFTKLNANEKVDVKGIEIVDNSYLYLLNECVKNEIETSVSVEQMNFLSEFLVLGGKKDKIKVVEWEMYQQINKDSYAVIIASKEPSLTINTKVENFLQSLVEENKLVKW